MLEVISVVSGLASAVCLIAVMASERPDFGWIAAGCFGSFITLRAMALGLRMLDDIRRAIVVRAGAEEAAHPSWGEDS
jgi:hypothetical protein